MSPYISIIVPIYNVSKYIEKCPEWRTVSFEEEVLDIPNYQGNAVMNFTDAAVPYTRIIEHKHFEMFGQKVYDCPNTVISREYSRRSTKKGWNHTIQ